MSNDTKKFSLAQSAEGEDHAAKILREKIGDLLTLNTQPPAPVTVQTAALAGDQKALEQKIIEALQTVYDPEIPLNIYDLGLIYRLELDPANAVKIDMTLTAPGCPVAGEIVASVKRIVEAIPEVPKVEVELVWEPAWTRDRLSEAAHLELGM